MADKTLFVRFGLGARILVAAVLSCTTACLAKDGVRVARVPDGGIHPQAAQDTGGRLHLVYFKGDAMHGDAWYVRSDDGGVTFGKPLRVNSHPQSVVVAGTVRGPHLAIGNGGRVHVAWMGSSKAEPKSGGKSAPMLYARLNDAGDAFEAQRDLIVEHPGLDGGGSVAADGEGNVYVAWHSPGDAQSHEEEGRRVWVVRSRDDGKTFDKETAADERGRGVCACCGMRVFAAGAGRVFILYRAATEMVNRDVLLLASRDHGKTFTVAAEDKWEIAKCVMSTAAFAHKPSGEVLAAWETREQIRLGLIGKESAREASKWSAPGRGKNRKHPTLAVNGAGESLLAWTEETAWKKGGSVAWQLFDREGRPVPARAGQSAGLPIWGVPAAVALADGTFLVLF